MKQLYEFNDPATGRDYRDYELYITGHSLGGALTQLFAFSVASMLEESGIKAKVINAISYASPRVGNSDYQKAFKALEQENKLRHIRVSNQYDVVAVAPILGYYQTGVNLFVAPNQEMNVAYLADKSMFSQTSCSSVSRHSLDSYFEHIFQRDANDKVLNQKYIDMDIEQLYETGGFKRE